MERGNQSRRNFIGNTAKAGIALTALSGIPSILSASDNFEPSGLFKTGFNQEPLPYGYDALEPVIDAQTMELHYSKHAAAYSKNLIEAAEAEKINTNRPLEEVLMKVSKYSAKVRNNGGGHYNHELFWKSMKANGEGKPSGALLAAIEKEFGSFDDFKTKFGDAAKTRFGSGWAWLVLDKNKKLVIGSTPNQDNPLMDLSEIKGMPLLGLDVWEHAYYLKYQNKRPDYISNWWKVVNWEFVSKRFDNQITKGLDPRKENLRVQKLVVFIAVLLFAIKVIAYFLTRSVAILTDALESIANVTAGFIGLFSLYIAARPKDQNHPYGHGKAEFISASVEGTLIIVAGTVIIYHSIYTMLYPHPIKQLDYGMVLVGITAVINYTVGYISIRNGKKNNSLALIASGKHLQSDTWSTLGIIAGLILIYFTGLLWLDSVVAMIFAVIIIITGYRILRKSIAGIMDESGLGAATENGQHTSEQPLRKLGRPPQSQGNKIRRTITCRLPFNGALVFKCTRGTQ